MQNYKVYVISFAPGTAGSFLSVIFASVVSEYNILNATISDVGDCHEFGNGRWTSDYCGGISEDGKTLLDIDNKPVIITHAMFNDIEKPPKNAIKVRIHFTEKDYILIATLRTYKQYPYLWNKNEYDAVKGDNWPGYSKFNIQDSKIIRDELINVHSYNYIKQWNYKANVDIRADFVINFTDVIGITGNLQKQVEYITGHNISLECLRFIDKYHDINKMLYKEYIDKIA